MTDEFVVEPARDEDLGKVEALLQQAGLPTSGVGDQFPTMYLVVRCDQVVVAAGGVERHESWGLLRSVVVASGYQGRGIGARLVEHLLSMATAAELSKVCLLTTTAVEYFLRFGFAPVSRDRLPLVVRRTPEFASLCPASATCLVWSRFPASFA